MFEFQKAMTFILKLADNEERATLILLNPEEMAQKYRHALRNAKEMLLFLGNQLDLAESERDEARSLFADWEGAVAILNENQELQAELADLRFWQQETSSELKTICRNCGYKSTCSTCNINHLLQKVKP